MLPCEQEAGISYEDVGIDIARCRGGDNCKVYCPRCHDQRKNRSDLSLSVHIPRGEWVCHHCGWASGLGVEARDRGIHAGRGGGYGSPLAARERQPAHPRPVAPMNAVAYDNTTLHPWAVEWARERSLSEDALHHFQVSSREVPDRETGEIQQVIDFPYFLPDGTVVNVKKRRLPKSFIQSAGAPKVLYNLPAIIDADTIVICEGEADVIACHMAGWTATVSPQDGAPGEKRDANNRVIGMAEVGSKGDGFEEPVAAEALDNARRIIIATDNDPGGNALADWLTEKFGAVKCWRVQFPKGCKDANDVLRQHGPEKLEQVIASAKPVPMPGVRSLGAHREALKRLYRDGYMPGVTTGWPEFDHYWMPETGQVVIVSGWSGFGKSTWLNNLLVNLAHHNNWNIAMYSPEQSEEGELLRRLVQVANDAPLLPGVMHRMSEEAMDIGIDWVDDHFDEIFCDDKDAGGFASLTVPKILDQASPVVMRNNAKILVIDPWNEVESRIPQGMNQEQYINASLSTIRNWARRNDCTVIVVAHARKPESMKAVEENPPNPYETAGAAHWRNKADVFLTVHRFKDEASNQELTKVQVWKHRKERITGNKGICLFGFDPRSERFYFHENGVPALIGTNPYPELPAHLRVSTEAVMGEAVYHTNSSAWQDEEAF